MNEKYIVHKNFMYIFSFGFHMEQVMTADDKEGATTLLLFKVPWSGD